MAKSRTAIVNKALLGIADTVSRTRRGTFIARRSFFYRHECNSEKFANRVSEALKFAHLNHIIVNHYEQWTPFRGGDSIAKGSHWGVEFQIIENKD